MYRVGLGSDIHKFAPGRKLFLGGLEIPHEQGLEGHSDADVILHALGDAILGAAALGDLGQHFPADELNKDRPSSEILHEICILAANRGYKIVNTDIVVMAEAPTLAPYREMMTERIAGILNVEKHQVGLKATTCEGLGAIGRQEGIYAQAIVLLEKRKL